MAGRTDKYREKRDFGKTPEPPPSEGAHCDHERIYVVHRHDARRLHYDLRLAAQGVLKSWAIPKGFSWEPSEKRLAVRTEDHPMEYESFEGTIPKGEYGAGTMTVWDKGTYRLAVGDDLAEEIGKGDVKLIFRGRRLRGEWHLVKTRRDGSDWIVFKSRDKYALEEGEEPCRIDLGQGKEISTLRAPRMMRPKGQGEPFDDPGWTYEMDFAGQRAFLTYRDGTAALIDGDRQPIQGELENVLGSAQALRAERCWLDGILVALDDRGRPDRDTLQESLRHGGSGEGDTPIQYYVFDILFLDGWDLRRLTLRERKEILRAVVPSGGCLLPVEGMNGQGQDLHRAVVASGLPGVIGKRLDSVYVGKASTDWLKIPASATASTDRSLVESLGNVGGVKSRVKVTNPTKIYWPGESFTKGDLIAYYEAMADFLIPYLRDRPLHLYRFPDGIEGKSFYQKNAPSHLPSWIRTETLPSGGKDKAIRYIVCQDRETLKWIINTGSIDLHPWSSRLGSLEEPDWTILDLDPKKAPFSWVIRIARSIAKVLGSMELKAVLKTSGSTGMHIYMPLEKGLDYDQGRMLSEAIARYVVRENPDIATVERNMERRYGRVYVDFGQNRRSQTVVAPYVVRPVPGARVSTPLEWDELEGDLDPASFDIHSVPQRVSRKGDLFGEALRESNKLTAAIDALERLMESG